MQLLLPTLLRHTTVRFVALFCSSYSPGLGRPPVGPRVPVDVSVLGDERAARAGRADGRV